MRKEAKEFGLGLSLLLLGAGLTLAQSVVVLSPSTSPTAGQPGVTSLTVTGSGFPAGSIASSSVTVSLQATILGTGPSAITTATAVQKIIGTTERVIFQVPSSIAVVSPTSHQVSISGNTSVGSAFSSGNTAVLTINPSASIASITPSASTIGQTVAVTINGSYTNFLQGATQVSFGAAIVVSSVQVNSATSLIATVVISPAASTSGPQTVTVTTGLQQESILFTIKPPSSGPPAITDFNPKSASVGTVINVTGENFLSSTGTGPTITLNKQGGGSIPAPVSSSTATNATFVIPAGAATGPVGVTTGSQTASSSATLAVVTSSDFTLSVGPATATLLPGQSVTYAVTANSPNGFDGLASLSVIGVPNGIQSSFKPTAITAGQTAVLTLTAAANQTSGTATLSISAAAMIQGQSVTQSQTANLQISAVTTSFLGRTVVDDTQETPIAGVTVKFLGKDASGNVTGCSGQTISDTAGNFLLKNLPSPCVGPQLISYDGVTATSPAGKYAGVNLSYTLSAGQVTTSPVLIHLPRIDNAETVMVQQNAATDQVFRFQTMPNLVVTVYAGTKFYLDDGRQPNPFPLVAINVPVDRLPDQMPSSGTVMPFIVAFQPANAYSSQPVAVDFPNSLNMSAGASSTFMTLDPTRGFMVPYGTGTVASDGTEIIADPDPSHPGHHYGLVHFDWHGPVARPPNQINPCYDRYCPCVTHPVDISSGLAVIRNTDISISGPRGTISIERVYRPAFVYGSNNLSGGPFGYGTNHNYGYALDTIPGSQTTLINLVMPDGNQFPYPKQADGTFRSSGVPLLAGSVMTVSSGGHADLRWKNGTVYHFGEHGGPIFYELLDSITDSNGNSTTFQYTNGTQLSQITDPTGRWIKLFYDGIISPVVTISDSSGRTLHYEYDAATGQFPLLTTFTNANGEKTSYGYNTFDGSLSFLTNNRSIVFARYTYDANQRVTQEQLADGSITKFAYTLTNPSVGTSPVTQTVVTDGLGHQTTYRFNTQGFLIGVTNALGQTRTLNRDGSNNVVAIAGPGACPVCGVTTAGDQSLSYDNLGNLTGSTDALGNTTTYTYDPTFNNVTSIIDPLGNLESFGYDAKGNLTSITDPNGNKTQLTVDQFGTLSQVTDPLGNKTSFSRDSQGNVVSTTDPLGNVSQALYDGVSRPIQLTDALGRTTNIKYDAVDRVLSQTDAFNKTTTLSYDQDGNLSSVTDADGNTTQYSYNNMDELESMTDPLAKSDSRIYDANGNLISFTDRRAQSSQFVYDVLDRLSGETYDDGSTVSRTYDANGRLSTAFDSLAGEFDYSYDIAGRLLSSANQFGSVSYNYDQGSRLISRQVAGQAMVQYSYDEVGNLNSAAMPQASATFIYHGDNRLTTINRANNMSSKYVYDNGGRLLSITHVGGAVNIPLTYYYDAVGNRVSQSTSLGQPLITQAVTSTFNNANQLISFRDTSGTADYSFDANGNLLSAAGPSGTTSYIWDTRNRLTSILQPNGQRTAFLYDFGINLLQQTDSGPALDQIQQFVLDQLTNVAYVSNSNTGSLSVLNGLVLDEDLAGIYSDGTVEYGLKDAVNSTIGTTGANGRLLGTFLYEPFGQTTISGSTYPFQFTGRTRASNNVFYYRARFYNSQTGRFINEDPIGFAGGDVNLYRYVWNASPNVVDPIGLTGWFGQLANWADQQAGQLADQNHFALAGAEYLAEDFIRIGVAFSPLDIVDTISDPCKSLREKFWSVAEGVASGAIGALGKIAEDSAVPTKVFYSPWSGWGAGRSFIGQAAWGTYRGVKWGSRVQTGIDFALGTNEVLSPGERCGCQSAH